MKDWGKVFVLAALCFWGAISSAHAQEVHQRVIIDDGANAIPPHAPLGSTTNPMNVTGGSSSGGGSSVGYGNITTASQVSCASTATPLVSARTGAAGTGRGQVLVEQLGTVNVYIGGSSVTTGSGLLLPGVVGAALTLPTTAALDCITASTSQAVAVMELY